MEIKSTTINGMHLNAAVKRYYFVAKMIFTDKLLKIVLALIVIGIIAACGGGSGDDDPDPVVTQTGSVSGRLIAPAYVVTDSDVNDIKTTSVPNHPLGNAQSVPNPVNIGGYVNVAGAGRAGNSQTSGDRDDYFLVNMTKGQTLLLNIGDIEEPDVDLDLYLYDINGTELDRSTGISKYESLIVPADGQYYIDVYAFKGASNYLLSLGLTPASALPPNAFRLSDEFIPGEILVKFDKSSFQAKAQDTTLSQFSMKQGGENAAGVQLLKLNRYFIQTAAHAKTAVSLDEEQQLKVDTLMAIKELSRRSDVIYAQPNYLYQPSAVPNDEYYSYQWHYPQINLPQAWDITTGASSVIVSVIDTGVLLSHPDLSGQLVAGYDFISSPDISGDDDGIDNDPNDVGDAGEGGSSSFHGSHVAGTIAAASNNSRGVAGVAWGTRIMPIRVLGKGGGTSYDIIQGILFSAGLPNDSGTLPAQRADVINMSLGGEAADQATLNAITAARNAGVIIIAAAGNENTSVLSYPASYVGVVSVSAVDLNRTRASYSNYGTKIDVAAPGGDVMADLNGDGKPDGVLSTAADDSSGSIQYTYTFYDGTSMAAPHVAGVVALMKSVYPGLTPAEFDSMLLSGELTSDIGATGRDDLYGYGLIDAYKAVAAAQQRGGGGAHTDPTLSVNPQSLNFASTLQSTTLYIEEIGGSVGTVQVSENIAWLAISPSQVNDSGMGSYSVTVNRSELAVGTYNGTIQVTAGSSSVSVEVIMQVTDISQSGDAGRQYVLLLDKVTNEPIQLFSVEAEGTNANYSFSNVPFGDYLIKAGSDMDMDDFICDAGESCGAYPTLSQPSVITVDSGSLSDLDFTTSFEYQTPSSLSSQGARVQEHMVYLRRGVNYPALKDGAK
jgi:serine protease